MANYDFAYVISDLGVVYSETGMGPYTIADGTYTVGGIMSAVANQSAATISGTFDGYTTGGVVIHYTYGYRYVTNEVLASGSNIGALWDSGDYTVTCFLEGTLIACPEGERPVETLAIGDLVLTASGEALPVRWMGRQTVPTLFADPFTSHPIRISAGALGDGLPRRDLFVSPSHALLMDGVLVQARLLVNGTTIAQVRPQAERFTYFHIEFETHAVVLAEGAPAESFVDSNDSRARFQNHAEFVALYGVDAHIAEPSALPRATSSRQLPHRLKARLAAISAGRDEAAAA